MKIQVGQPHCGKSYIIEQSIKESKKKKLIIDNRNKFDDIGHIIYLDEYSPFLEELTLNEVKVLNAGYLKWSRSLVNRAEDIFRETGENSLKFVVQDALERMHASMDDKWGEAEYARELSDRIPKKISVKLKPLNKVLELFSKYENVIVKVADMHSDDIRAMIFFLIYKVSLQTDQEIEVYADEQSTLFFNGNTKLLFEVIDINQLDMVISCNKASNIPKNMKDVVTEWRLFRNMDKSEVRYIVNNFDIGHNIDFAEIPLKSYEIISKG